MTAATELGTLLETPNEDGRLIRCLLELPENGDQDAPCVIVAPSYALSMRHFGPLSLFLTRNGFRSLRFDYTNHVGASDGDVYDFRLTTAATDLRAVLGAVKDWGVYGPVGVISVSMGARIAFRALRGQSDIATLVSLVGVVNLQDTLYSVVGEDVVAESLRGRTPHDREVLGYQMSGLIVDDAVAQNMHTLESTKDDLAHCLFPITHVFAEDDAWTTLEEVESVFCEGSDTAARQLYILPEASHKLEYNPVAARTAFSLAVCAVARELTGAELAVEQVVSPSFNDVVDKHRQEKSLDGEASR
jgi:pimeloyl-ACP methyl ester carboxylesterase